METENLKDGDQCIVIGGTHKGKSGTVRIPIPVKQVMSPLLSNRKMAFGSKLLERM